MGACVHECALPLDCGWFHVFDVVVPPSPGNSVWERACGVGEEAVLQCLIPAARLSGRDGFPARVGLEWRREEPDELRRSARVTGSELYGPSMEPFNLRTLPRPLLFRV